MCNQVNVCHLDADCYDTALGPKCVCRNGFIGDGVSCTAIQGKDEDMLKILLAQCTLWVFAKCN